MALRGSFSRSLLAAARSSPAAPPLLRPAVYHLRNPAALRCVQSLLPLHSVVAGAALTSHLSASARVGSELFRGTSRRTCQAR